MKRKRSILIGLACGVLCAVCVAAYVMQVDEQASAVRAEALARYGGEQIEVCVAKRDIAAGEMNKIFPLNQVQRKRFCKFFIFEFITTLCA